MSLAVEIAVGAAIAIFASLLVYVWQTERHSSTREPYGEFHTSLNKSQKPDTGHTEWLNMGYWKVRRLRIA
jgi:hypothetical protein